MYVFSYCLKLVLTRRQPIIHFACNHSLRLLNCDQHLAIFVDESLSYRVYFRRAVSALAYVPR